MTLGDGRRVLAIIPVRSGSKRILGKNLRLFNGKELFRWTLEAALDSKQIDKILVSTDSEDVIRIAESYSAGMSFRRGERTSDDYASSDDVITEILKEFGSKFEVVIYLQPTSPLRGVAHIDHSLSSFGKVNTSIVSIAKSAHNPLWAFLINANGHLIPLAPQFLNTRSQDLPSTYYLNGAIYIAAVEAYSENHTFLTSDATPFIMEPEDSIDIDNEKDFKDAEDIARRNTR
jgi:CMP-N-acetylneuraminic acid synthetase